MVFMTVLMVLIKVIMVFKITFLLGATAYGGVVGVLKPKEGQTLFVSAATVLSIMSALFLCLASYQCKYLYV